MGVFTEGYHTHFIFLVQASYQITLTGSKMQNETRVTVVENMTKSLAKKPWIAKHRKLKHLKHLDTNLADRGFSFFHM
jgi:hypothetical protein